MSCAAEQELMERMNPKDKLNIRVHAALNNLMIELG